MATNSHDTEIYFLDEKTRRLHFVCFSIFAVVQLAFFLYFSWPIAAKNLLRPQLEKQQKDKVDIFDSFENEYSHLVPKKYFTRMDLFAVYVSSEDSLGTFSEFSTQMELLYQGKRDFLSALWGEEFNVFLIQKNFSAIREGEFIPELLKETAKNCISSDSLYYIYVDNPKNHPTTKIYDQWNCIVDYRSSVSDFIPIGAYETLLKMAIVRMLSYKHFSGNNAIMEIERKIMTSVAREGKDKLPDRLIQLIELLEECRRNAVKSKVDRDRYVPPQYLLLFFPVLSAVVFPIPLFTLKSLRKKNK